MSFPISPNFHSSCQSSSIIIQLVNPDGCSNPLLKKEKEPHVSVANFGKLIQPTPFQKYQAKTITLTITTRSKSSPTFVSNTQIIHENSSP